MMFFDWIRKKSRPQPGIWLLIGVCVVVFWGQIKGGTPQSFNLATSLGDLETGATRTLGEWWRLFTATIMHGFPAHLLLNMTAIFSFGKYVHRLTHPLIPLIVFVFSAFTGALASLLCHPAGSSVGASGGAVGLIGFLVWLGVSRRGQLPYHFHAMMITNVVLLCIIGVAGSKFLDNWGHGGGLVGGMICGIIYDFFNKDQWDIPNSPAKSVLGAVSFAVLLFGFSCCLDLFYFDSQYLIPHLPRISW